MHVILWVCRFCLILAFKWHFLIPCLCQCVFTGNGSQEAPREEVQKGHHWRGLRCGPANTDVDRHRISALSAALSSACLSARLALSSNPLTRAKSEGDTKHNIAYSEPVLCKIRVGKRFAQNSRAHHSAYFGKRALEETRGATFAEIPRFFCNGGLNTLVGDF